MAGWPASWWQRHNIFFTFSWAEENAIWSLWTCAWTGLAQTHAQGTCAVSYSYDAKNAMSDDTVHREKMEHSQWRRKWPKGNRFKVTTYCSSVEVRASKRIFLSVYHCGTTMLGLWFSVVDGGDLWATFHSMPVSCAVSESTVSRRSIFVIVTISTVWNKVFFYIHQLAILRHSNIWLNQFLFATWFAPFIRCTRNLSLAMLFY